MICLDHWDVLPESVETILRQSNRESKQYDDWFIALISEIEKHKKCDLPRAAEQFISAAPSVDRIRFLRKKMDYQDDIMVRGLINEEQHTDCSLVIHNLISICSHTFIAFSETNYTSKTYLLKSNTDELAENCVGCLLGCCIYLHVFTDSWNGWKILRILHVSMLWHGLKMY